MQEVEHFQALAVECNAQRRAESMLMLWRGYLPGAALLCLVMCVLLPARLLADEGTSTQVRLIELFTSQSCSSCPAAEKLLGELLAEDENLLALEFHVDYWNALEHGDDGSFTDRFSNSAHSDRQRQYNSSNLAGRPGVYTPQAVINGQAAYNGSVRAHILNALARPVESALEINITQGSAEDSLQIAVTGNEIVREVLSGTDIMLARYLDTASTEITGGENAGRVLVNHHVVTAFTLLGEVSAEGDIQFTVTSPAEGEGCVVLIQEEALTHVYAAVSCP